MARKPATIPVGRLVFNSNRTGNHECYAADPDGTDLTRLTSDPAYDSWWCRISPDRRRFLFVRTPRGTFDKDYNKTSLWVQRLGGLPVCIIPEDTYGLMGHPEWSPDGRRIVVFTATGGTSQLWTIAADGTDPRTLPTPGWALDPAYSPDGTSIVFCGTPTSPFDYRNLDIYEVPLNGGPARQVNANDVMRLRDHDPYYSPDGTRIAYLVETSPPDLLHPGGVWNIRLLNADGSNPRWVTADGNVNSKPAWSHDGTTIYFHRLVYGRGDGFRLWSVNVTTGALTELPQQGEYPGT